LEKYLFDFQESLSTKLLEQIAQLAKESFGKISNHLLFLWLRVYERHSELLEKITREEARTITCPMNDIEEFSDK